MSNYLGPLHHQLHFFLNHYEQDGKNRLILLYTMQSKSVKELVNSLDAVSIHTSQSILPTSEVETNLVFMAA